MDYKENLTSFIESLNEYGVVEIGYEVNDHDELGARISERVTLSIRVTAVNDEPLGESLLEIVTEDMTIEIAIAGTDVEDNLEGVLFTRVSDRGRLYYGDVDSGTVVSEGVVYPSAEDEVLFNYVPSLNDTGDVIYRYEWRDKEDALSSENTQLISSDELSGFKNLVMIAKYMSIILIFFSISFRLSILSNNP